MQYISLRFPQLILYIRFFFQKGPLRLYYTVYTNPAKRFKADNEERVPMETDLADVTNNSDLKTETSGYITDEDKNVSENEKSMSVETDDGERNDSLLDDIVKDSDSVKIGNIVIEETQEVVGKKTSKTKSAFPECHAVKHDCDEVNVKNKCDQAFDKEMAATKQIDSVTKISKSDTPLYNDDEKCVQSECESNENMNECIREGRNSKYNEHNLVDTNRTEGCQQQHKIKCTETLASKEFKREKPEMVEASTDTHYMSNGYEKCSVQTPKQSKSSITDEDISEPVVSSTQNTQGCQTEPPESNTEPLNTPHSSDIECIASSVSPSCKSTVDVSCETDNFVLSRRMSVDSVSVSTETDTDDGNHKTQKRKLVDCSTDVYDFPKSESNKKLTVDCSTDFEGFPVDSIKRHSLTVDCSTSIDNCQPPAIKRKSMDIEVCSDSNKGMKKTDIKAVKRSFSYASHLTSPKTAYLSQPLSPTKLTLKFTSPKSPAKTRPNTPAPKSPSRAETTGFQSKYQSFVMDEKTYRFEDNDLPKPSKSSPTHNKSCGNLVISVPQTLPATQKKTVSSKTGRPRGRPPKNRSLDLAPPPKEKKHKSRSHSPKHRKHSDKDKDGCVEKLKISKSPTGSSKSTTAYSWINKLDGDSKLSSDKKSQKVKQTSANEKIPSDLRIPKQFLYFSNGQYTIATVSSLNALKQSSPVSPPPKTVFTAEINAKSKSKHSESETKKQKTTTNETKDKEEKTSEKHNDKNITKSVDSVTENRSQVNNTDCKTSPKIDSNQNTIERTSTAKSDATKIESEKIQADGSKKESDLNKDISKEKTTTSLPEYRHQSPFFASISNAKLQAPHRATAHLNVPNISSHFSGTHHLYSQGRYSSERIAPPVYRSLSMNDNSPSSTLASKFEEARRLEAIASVSHGYLSHFPAPYLGLMHSHLVSSLPPPPPLSKHGHMPESSRSLSFSEGSPTNANVNSHNATKQLNKSGGATPKGKEKSIDRIISAITERKTKKETQEQINGIDLSTKSSRHSEKLMDSVSTPKTDKFEFTDDDHAPVSHKKVVAGKVEHAFDIRKEKV